MPFGPDTFFSTFLFDPFVLLGVPGVALLGLLCDKLMKSSNTGRRLFVSSFT